MLSVIMLILQFLGRRLDPGIDGLRAVSHLGHFLQHYRVMHGFLRILSPGKGAVIFTQHRRHRHRILAQTIK